jgi:hypothetical protein
VVLENILQLKESDMFRSILAVVLGIALGVALIVAIQAASMAIYPPPEGLDWNDPKAMSAHVRNMPTRFCYCWPAMSSALLPVAGWPRPLPDGRRWCSEPSWVCFSWQEAS